MLEIKEIIDGLKNIKLDVSEDMLEDYAPIEVATLEEIVDFEEKSGIILPNSYKEFLTTYSNGETYILGIEPLYGVGINHNTYNSFGLLNFVNSKEEIEHIEEKVWTEGWENEQLEKRKQWLREKWEQKVQILPENREVHLKHLVPVTYADYYECSSDHWAFICDKEYENHDYPMGFVSQGTGNIIYVVKNFQEWLNLFWEYNKSRTNEFLPVIHGLIPDEDKRRDLLECGMEE